MRKVTYTGDAPGQAARIRMGGFLFSRGETYDMNAADVKRLGLDDKGGFEVASVGTVKKRKSREKK
jgi:hypothetical protein